MKFSILKETPEIIRNEIPGMTQSNENKILGSEVLNCNPQEISYNRL